MRLSERPGQQAPVMQETFLCTQTKAIKSTNPVAHPDTNPRRNAKHGCFERQSEDILGDKSIKSRCNTSQVERQKVAVVVYRLCRRRRAVRVWVFGSPERRMGQNWTCQAF